MIFHEILSNLNAARIASIEAWNKNSAEQRIARERRQLVEISHTYSRLVMISESGLYNSVKRLTEQNQNIEPLMPEIIDNLIAITGANARKSIRFANQFEGGVDEILLASVPDQETKDYIRIGAASEAALFWRNQLGDENAPTNVRIVAAVRRREFNAKIIGITEHYARTKGRGPLPHYPGQQGSQ